MEGQGPLAVLAAGHRDPGGGPRRQPRHRRPGRLDSADHDAALPRAPVGAGGPAAAHTSTLRELFGTDDVAFTGVNGAGRMRHYTSLSQAVDEIVDARVWSGVHFRTADVQAAALGRAVARARTQHHPILEPLRHR